MIALFSCDRTTCANYQALYLLRMYSRGSFPCKETLTDTNNTFLMAYRCLQIAAAHATSIVVVHEIGGKVELPRLRYSESDASDSDVMSESDVMPDSDETSEEEPRA